MIFEMIVVAASALGVYLSALKSSNGFMGGNRVFMYFTIQSNIMIGIMCLIGALRLLRDKPAGRAGEIVKLVGTVSITLTGVVFCFVLAPTIPNSAWDMNNLLTHVVVPVVSVLDFFAVGCAYTYKKRDTLWVVVPPLMYAVYAGIGYVNGWDFGGGQNYPYFFLNWGSQAGVFGFSNELPFMGTGWWIIALLLFLIAIGLLYIVIASRIGRRLNKTGH